MNEIISVSEKSLLTTQQDLDLKFGTIKGNSIKQHGGFKIQPEKGVVIEGREDSVSSSLKTAFVYLDKGDVKQALSIAQPLLIAQFRDGELTYEDKQALEILEDTLISRGLMESTYPKNVMARITTARKHIDSQNLEEAKTVALPILTEWLNQGTSNQDVVIELEYLQFRIALEDIKLKLGNKYFDSKTQNEIDEEIQPLFQFISHIDDNTSSRFPEDLIEFLLILENQFFTQSVKTFLSDEGRRTHLHDKLQYAWSKFSSRDKNGIGPQCFNIGKLLDSLLPTEQPTMYFQSVFELANTETVLKLNEK